MMEVTTRLCVWCGKRNKFAIHDICWLELKKWAMEGQR